MKTDTIAAIATPPGIGALGVIRLSGPDSFQIVSQFFLSKPSILEAEAWRAIFGTIPDSTTTYNLQPATLDSCIAIKYAAPKSYTGENMVELITHGSPVILRQVMEAACRMGARPAQAGEFTARAFRNGKLDLVQAEAVCGLIQASSERSAKLSARAVSGMLSRSLRGAREKMIEAMAALDVLIDHPDEPEITEDFSAQRTLGRIQEARKELESIAAGFRRAVKIREGSVWVIAGSPNAGKSTLFNQLLQKDRSIVSSIAGTTRDTIEEAIELDGHLIRLVDTAGLRQAQDAVEGLGIQRTRKAVEAADGVIFILDGSRETAVEEKEAIARFTNQGKPVIVVINKTDLSHPGENRVSAGDSPGRGPGLDSGWSSPAVAGRNDSIRISALKGTGLDEIREAVKKTLEAAPASEEETILEERHAALISDACARLAEAAAHGEKELWELASVSTRQATGDLDLILGQGDITEEVLSSIFSKFCVGK